MTGGVWAEHQKAVSIGGASADGRITIGGGVQSALFLVQSTAPVVGFREHDTCANVASIYVASIADAAATYAVKPLGPGTCTATVRNEAGASIAIPIAVR